MEHSHVWKTETLAGRTIMSRSLQVYPHKNGKDGGYGAELARKNIEESSGRPAYLLVCREDCTAMIDWTDGTLVEQRESPEREHVSSTGWSDQFDVPVALRPNEARRFA